MFYNWLLYSHLASIASFLLAHGSSAAMAFVLRRQQGTDRIRALLDLDTGDVWVDLGVACPSDRDVRRDGGARHAVQHGPAGGRHPARPAGGRNPSSARTARGASACCSSHPTTVIALVGVLALAALMCLMIMKPF